MQTIDHELSNQLGRHILENKCTSTWLKRSFELALLRDPVDAQRDADVLAAALDARCLAIQGADIALAPEITTLLLLQHAVALEKINRHLGGGTGNQRLGELVNRLHCLVAEISQA